MRDPRELHGPDAREDQWLEDCLEGARDKVRAPHGFAQRVMDAVYGESLAGRPVPSPAASRRRILEHAVRASRPMLSRMYRRLGLSFVLTAAVLAASLLVPHGAYTMLINSGADAALGAGPSAAVQNAILGAGHTVQGALGESHIGGNQE